jgi:hypothetical protein
MVKELEKDLPNKTPGVELTTDDISGLLLWCGYKINVSGSGTICLLFINDGFIRDGYYNDLLFQLPKLSLVRYC